MKTRYFAGACALALSAGAQAQTISSGFYGRANLSVESQKIGSTSSQKMVDNSSRLGFTADRTIGKDLKAGVVLEAGTNLTSGSSASPFFARQANTWLAGEFGELRLGRLLVNTAYFAGADAVSFHNHDTGTSADAFFDVLGKMNNAVSYTAPNVGGFKLVGQLGLKNGSGTGNNVTDKKVNPIALSAETTMSGVGLGLGFDRGENAAGQAVSATAVRANYTDGAFTYGGYIQSSSGTDNKRTAWRLSGMYTLDKSEFHLNLGAAGKRSGIANSGATQVTLAYNYNLDKATKLYGFITNVNNDAAASYSVSTKGQDLRSIGVGFRYNF